MTKKFSKPPLTETEKEKKAEKFLNFFESNVKKEQVKNQETSYNLKKEPVLTFSLRLPRPVLLDLDEICALTGSTRNATCLELLRIGSKTKLKELKSEI